jgi:hypothetical protein
MAITKKPPARRTLAASGQDQSGKLIFTESSEPTFQRQVHRLAFRFFLPVATAAVVAEHAFSKGGGR